MALFYMLIRIDLQQYTGRCKNRSRHRISDFRIVEQEDNRHKTDCCNEQSKIGAGLPESGQFSPFIGFFVIAGAIEPYGMLEML